MANDVQDRLRDLLQNAIEGAGRSTNGSRGGGSGGPLSGTRGLAVGAGAAALAPLAIKNFGKLSKVLGLDALENVVKAPGKALGGATSNLGDKLGSGIGDKVTDKVDEAGGPSGILKDTVKDALPFGGGGGGGGGGKGGSLGVGKGRRMPVQQSVDIGAPVETVYNQFTQFEDWPTFMHRVRRVTQEDDCTVSFAAKIWGKTKEFTAKIETQRPNERIKWRVTQGITHTGVVTFHELAPNLTRVLLDMDVEPGGLLEKAARGMRHIKRAARGDLHRFKALIELSDQESGAWRGVIEDGELVEEHDPSYDEQRDYADIEEVTEASEQDDEDDEDDEDREDESDDDKREQEPEESRPRAQRRASSSGRSSSGGRTRRASSSGRRSGSSGGSSSTRSSQSRRSSSGQRGRQRDSSRTNGRNS
jgi:uncharacterized membrane protein YgcG